MKASELVARLQALMAEHGDVPVLVQGYEGGADDLQVAFDSMCQREHSDEYMGRYDWARREAKQFKAVVLTRDHD